MKKLNPYILFCLILLSLAGISLLLKVVGYESVLTLIGFRIYIPLIIPVILILAFGDSQIIKSAFEFIRLKGFWVVFVILLIYLISGTSFWYIEKFKFKEPEFFYELGLSSIIDFPVYLVWNSILFAGLFLVYSYFKSVLKGSMFFLLFLNLAIIIMELYPFDFKLISLPTIALLAAFLTLETIIIFKVNNPVVFWLINFSTIWFTVLLFGSNSGLMVKMVLARNYDNWEGFLKLSKGIWEFLPAISVIAVSLVTLTIKKSEKMIKT